MNALTLKKFGAVAASTAVLALGVITPALAQVGGTTDEQGSLGLGTIQTEAGFGQKNLYATVGSLIRVALSLLRCQETLDRRCHWYADHSLGLCHHHVRSWVFAKSYRRGLHRSWRIMTRPRHYGILTSRLIPCLFNSRTDAFGELLRQNLCYSLCVFQIHVAPLLGFSSHFIQTHQS
ncbi:MAG: hypothetical protein HW383_288 [Candidatus Magasanikbacteria bacterium]|nr:hypothetical protein [Candidatus Magasanikbacteria bacterium]